MIIAVSDWHLGYNDAVCPARFPDSAFTKQDAILKFLNLCETNESISHLVLVGDILDFWRRSNCKIFSIPEHYYDAMKKLQQIKNFAERMKTGIGLDEFDPTVQKIFKNQEIFYRLGTLPQQVHYVIGNHDYYLLKLFERNPSGFPFKVTKNLWLPLPSDDKKGYYFTHGYDLDVLANYELWWDIEEYERICEKLCQSVDKTGSVLSTLYSILEKLPYRSLKKEIWKIKKPAHKRRLQITSESMSYTDLFAQSKAKYLMIGMKPSDILIYGHTHVPFVNDDMTVANTGSWCNDCPGDKQFPYLWIQDEKIILKWMTPTTTIL